MERAEATKMTEQEQSPEITHNCEAENANPQVFL